MRAPEDITVRAPAIMRSIWDGTVARTAALALATAPSASRTAVRFAACAAWTSSSLRWTRIEGMSMATGQTS